MKKRLICLLLAIVLLVGVCPTTQAAVPICFVAMNDTIPVTLKGGAAPYYTNGTLFLPHTAFLASPNGVGASYNMEQNTFVLFNAGETLIFDLENKTYQNKNKEVFNVEVSYRSGLLYVSAKVVSHFGLSVTMLTSRGGYSIIRFTNGEQVYNDGTFVAQAENLINRAAQEYEAELAALGPGIDPVTEIPNEEPPEERGPIEVYLAFTGNAVEQETVDQLKEHEAKAAFFLTEDQILKDRDLVREIYANGHTIGITAAPEESDISGALVRANEALDRVLFCRTVLALLPAGTTADNPSLHTISRPVYKSMEELLITAETPELYVVDSGALGVIASLESVNASILKLCETTF